MVRRLCGGRAKRAPFLECAVRVARGFRSLDAANERLHDFRYEAGIDTDKGAEDAAVTSRNRPGEHEPASAGLAARPRTATSRGPNPAPGGSCAQFKGPGAVPHLCRSCRGRGHQDESGASEDHQHASIQQVSARVRIVVGSVSIRHRPCLPRERVFGLQVADILAVLTLTFFVRRSEENLGELVNSCGSSGGSMSSSSSCQQLENPAMVMDEWSAEDDEISSQFNAAQKPRDRYVLAIVVPPLRCLFSIRPGFECASAVL